MKHLKLLLCYSVITIQIIAQSTISSEWLTKFETSDFLSTSGYDETINYFKKLEQASPFAKLKTFGISSQGRNLYYFVVSKEMNFEATDLVKSEKPLILINNGIHAGEIEGKDACMLLLREILITKEKEQLIDFANIIVIPIFNVDGHERISKYNRINQNGPEEMGWRTTAQNYNLNRDFVKADSPEMQAFLKLFSTYLPDFFIDTHTTDGADYQYTITYEISKGPNVYTGTAKLVKDEILPFILNKVESTGYLIAPYVGFLGDDPESGLTDWVASPRLSNGYAIIQNRIGLLIETHMMKPYEQRVFSTKEMITAVLEYANINPHKILNISQEADNKTIEQYFQNKNFFPIQFQRTNEYENFLYKGIKFHKDSSLISGTIKTTYTGEKYEIEIPHFNKFKIVDSVLAPFGYIIPKEWEFIADRLRLHGVEIDLLSEDKEMTMTKYKFKNVKFNTSPYEGRTPVTVNYDTLKVIEKIPKGSLIVKCNQRTLRVILTALEPKSTDSFLRWGFMNQIFEKKEYFEPYVMEKEAELMLKNNPQLKKEFEQKLMSDEQFRNNPDARLNFFYERSLYFDSKLNVYPIFRIENSY